MSNWGDVAVVGAMIATFGLITFAMWAVWYSLTYFGILQTAVGAIALGFTIMLGSAAMDS